MTLVGERVRLTGLKGRADLNGSCGVVRSFDTDKGRYLVALDTDMTIALKPANVERADTAHASSTPPPPPPPPPAVVSLRNQIVNFLQQSGSNADPDKITLQELLASATSVGDVALVAAVLDADDDAARGPVDIDKPDGEGFSALHRACALGNVPMLALLLKRGANADVLDNAGDAPLHWACFTGKTFKK